MDLLLLHVRVVLEQRLGVLPARQRAHLTDIKLNDIDKARAGGVPENGSLHVSRLQLPATHADRASCVDQTLCYIHGTAVALGKAQADDDVVCGGASADRTHLGRVHSERVFDVLDCKHWVD